MKGNCMSLELKWLVCFLHKKNREKKMVHPSSHCRHVLSLSLDVVVIKKVLEIYGGKNDNAFLSVPPKLRNGLKVKRWQYFEMFFARWPLSRKGRRVGVIRVKGSGKALAGPSGCPSCGPFRFVRSEVGGRTVRTRRRICARSSVSASGWPSKSYFTP